MLFKSLFNQNQQKLYYIDSNNKDHAISSLRVVASDWSKPVLDFWVSTVLSDGEKKYKFELL